MRYYLIAGEASGDLHGSNLIKGLAVEDPSAEFRFWGGDLMADAAGCAPVRHYKDGAVMGFTDVLRKMGKLLGNLSDCKRDILRWKPDVVILIDYPGFNLKIAEFCHGNGIKVFYYIAPKTWASREKRNSELRKWVDMLFIVFPFEIPYFTGKGIPYIYKGNPLVDAVDCHNYEPLSDRPYVALLPGSRKAEISRMMPVCMELAGRLDRDVIVAGAPARTLADYEQWTEGKSNVRVVFGRTYDILKYADAAVVNSGTASLEAALIGTPQVVCWSTSPLTYFLAKRVLKVQNHIKYISLGNLCIDKYAFKELIQNDFTVENVARELDRLLSDRPYSDRMKEEYALIRESLGGRGSSEAVAMSMIDVLTNKI